MFDELEPISEDWSTALAIAAHPDDLEHGTAAGIARWTAQGKQVSYCLATRGEAGIDGIAPETAGPIREQEERTSAAIVGVDSVEFLGHPDGMLEHGLPLRRDLARAIRRHRPEVVVTVNYQPTFVNGVLNQADHIAVGRALLDAIRDAANRWVFRELLSEGFEPWNGVRTVLATGSPLSTHGVDVSDYFAIGLKSLRAHTAYLAGLGDGPMADPSAFLESRTSAAGRGLGCRYALPFEVPHLG